LLVHQSRDYLADSGGLGIWFELLFVVDAGLTSEHMFWQKRMCKASQHHVAAVRPCTYFFDYTLLMHACFSWCYMHMLLAFVPSLHARSTCVSGFH